jgi:hypothetical protein
MGLAPFNGQIQFPKRYVMLCFLEYRAMDEVRDTILPTESFVNKLYFVRFEVFTAVTMKNGVFWVVTPCGSCKNRRFGGTWRHLHQGDQKSVN